MNYSRREMLKLGAGAAALWTTGVDPLSAAEVESAKKKIPIGLQLYSVRQDCEKDLPGVLRAVAKMGYQGVEFAGYYGRNAKELRSLLDQNGLKCCGTHTGLNTLTGDALEGTIEFNKTLGNKFLIVPSLPGNRTSSVRALKETAKLLSELAEKAKPRQMRVGYHAHGGDFRRFDGETAWDIIFSNASPDVVMQLDLGNCISGGGDPIAILKKFPHRSATIHLKEHGGRRGAVIGQGNVDWKEIFRLCETTGGTEWYIVEQESYAASPLESVRLCIENLRKMGK
jgi:sugar phosphate isomerase/epimerase